MNVRTFFLPPYTRRRIGTFFILGAIAALILSTSSPTNYRDDWLDPRWLVRACAVLLIVCGTVMIALPFRGRDR